MGAQDFVKDPRNESVLVYLNGQLVPRNQASVSIFDAGFVLGDGIWEGLRLHKGRLAFLDAHLDRLFAGAIAIDLDMGLTRSEIVEALEKTLAANGMEDGVHIRLMVTRGLKRTPNQDPRHTIGPATVVIVAEYKVPPPEARERGISLFTSSIRCSPPDMFDMRLNSHSRLNLITALIQAVKAGADEALMLDPHGFISSCNSTNLFWISKGEVRTSSGEYCFNGITRQNVIDLCVAKEIPIRCASFPLSDIYSADEAFVTGTMGGVLPVRAVDGREIGKGKTPGSLTARLKSFYAELLESQCR